MCFSRNISFITFWGGLISCFLLEKFGKESEKKNNKKIALFFSFVICMQFIDFVIWSDLKDNKKLNSFAGIVGPLLNNFQPTIYYLLFYEKTKNRVLDICLMLLNIVYVLYVLYKYILYLKKKNFKVLF